MRVTLPRGASPEDISCSRAGVFAGFRRVSQGKGFRRQTRRWNAAVSQAKAASEACEAAVRSMRLEAWEPGSLTRQPECAGAGLASGRHDRRGQRGGSARAGAALDVDVDDGRRTRKGQERERAAGRRGGSRGSSGKARREQRQQRARAQRGQQGQQGQRASLVEQRRTGRAESRGRQERGRGSGVPRARVGLLLSPAESGLAPLRDAPPRRPQIEGSRVPASAARRLSYRPPASSAERLSAPHASCPPFPFPFCFFFFFFLFFFLSLSSSLLLYP
ncbi:hypothetical protein VTN02DRAFT_1199 [Thermoascus thermophilus]